jgi:hypothetical protein
VTNVVCASTDQRILPGGGGNEGVGDGDAEDAGAAGDVCALAGMAQIANATSARASAAGVVGLRFTILLMRLG